MDTTTPAAGGLPAIEVAGPVSAFAPVPGSEVPKFELYEFNPRRSQRGAEAARVRVTWPDGEEDFLWMRERDVLHNLREFGESEGLREVLRAYESGERRYPQNDASERLPKGDAQ